jgi:hypothetical protein
MTNEAIVKASRFSFVPRPIPVPGDLRISWRLPILVLMLTASRASRASLVKLYILNDALRSSASRAVLLEIMRGERPELDWRMRVEPAFGRAVDNAVGNGLVEWVGQDASRALQLTAAGRTASAQILAMKDVLTAEKAIIADLGRNVTEAMARTLATSRGGSHA